CSWAEAGWGGSGGWRRLVEVVTSAGQPPLTSLTSPTSPILLSCVHEFRPPASADPCRTVDPVEPRRCSWRGRPATGPHAVSGFPVAVRADGDPRARRHARPTGAGGPGVPARRPVRMPGHQ